MRPKDNDPPQKEIEKMVTDEERQTLANPDVPEDVKGEILERLEGFAESDLEEESPQ